MNPNGLTCRVRRVFFSCIPPLLSGVLFGGYGSISVKKAVAVRKKGAITVTLPALSKYLLKYAGTVTDPVLRRAFAEVFRKGPAALTAEDYREVWHIRFEIVNSSLLRADITLGNGSEKQVSIVSDGEGITPDGNSFQAFPNLEMLDMSGQRSLLQVMFSSQEYASAFANLKQLRCLYLPDRGEYPGSPTGLAYLVVNPDAIRGLGGVTLYATADIEKLVQEFPSLKKSRIVKREPGVTLSRLQGLKEPRVLYAPLRCADNEGLFSLTGVREMELIVSEGNEDIKEFCFLSDFIEPESLTIRDVISLLSLNDIKSLTKLRELRLSGVTQLTNLELLRGLTALRTPDLGGGLNLSNYAALYKLPQLKRLRIFDNWQAGCFMPDVTLLPALEELEHGAETPPQLARCQKLKRLALFLGHIGGGTDFSGLSRLSKFEELALNTESVTQNTERLSAFRELPKPRKVIFNCGQGTLPLHTFPAATEFTVLGETTGMDGDSSELRILAATGEGALALEKFSVFTFGVVRFEGYRNTALRKLCLGSCGIDPLAFTEASSNLELLNISGNRIEDIAPLTALPKLRYLCHMDNVI